MNQLTKLLLLFTISFFPFLPVSPVSENQMITLAQKPEPAYAKWGRLAMKETKAKYPNAQIIDYLHIGKTTSESIETEKFKLWMKENKREYGVFVNISFDSATQRVIKMTFIETER